MSVSRCRSVLICVSIALAACSGNTNAQSARAQAQPVQATTNAVPTAPTVESTIRALPDFSPLVEKYGPAVVNVAGPHQHLGGVILDHAAVLEVSADQAPEAAAYYG